DWSSDVCSSDLVDIPKQDFGDIDYNNDMQDILVLTGKEGRETIADPEFTDINYDEELDIDYLMDKFEEGTEDEEDYEDPESVTTTAFSVIRSEEHTSELQSRFD